MKFTIYLEISMENQRATHSLQPFKVKLNNYYFDREVTISKLVFYYHYFNCRYSEQDLLSLLYTREGDKKQAKENKNKYKNILTLINNNNKS